MDQNFTRSNQVMNWLRQLDALRSAAWPTEPTVRAPQMITLKDRRIWREATTHFTDKTLDSSDVCGESTPKNFARS